MVKENLNKKTAYSVKNVKDTLKNSTTLPNLENENLYKNNHVPKFINEKVVENQKVYEQQQKLNMNNNNNNSKIGGTAGGANKHFYSNDPNSYKPMESFSDYFKKSNTTGPLEGGKIQPNFNVGEMYKGFARFNSYAWGLAVSFGLVAYASFKIIDKFHTAKTSENNNSNKIEK